MSFDHIEFSIDGSIARITLNRPDVANTIGVEMAEELLDAALRCASQADIRAVVLSAQGRFFSGGGDVQAFAAAAEHGPELLRRITSPLHAAVSHFARMNAPLITAINGTAAGAGMSLAIAGDIVIAAQSAKFTMAYTKIGVSADGGGSYFLPRLVGIARAKELMLLNRVLTATDALEQGLVTQVVPDEQLAAKADEIAQSLAAGPTRAFGEVKRLLADSFANSLEQQLALESHSMSMLAAESEDTTEGFKAFTAKRSPQFKGR